MTYAEQLQIVKDIPIKEGVTKVITCPFCGGLKKLALSKMDGKLMWNCYRASCEGKGIYTGKRDLQSAKKYLSGQVTKRKAFVRPLPSITTAIENHRPALDYLEKVNSLEAYLNKYIKIRYDPGGDRVLFYAENGAVGRSLGSYGPKWVTFGTIAGGVHVGNGSTAVLVEDVPSACSVSRINGLVGVSLLGTTVTGAINTLTKCYQNRIIILDKDAASKAISARRRLGFEFKVRFTRRDLKFLTIDEIQYLMK